jgi:hypothetical protein
MPSQRAAVFLCGIQHCPGEAALRQRIDQRQIETEVSEQDRYDRGASCERRERLSACGLRRCREKPGLHEIDASGGSLPCRGEHLVRRHRWQIADGRAHRCASTDRGDDAARRGLI